MCREQNNRATEAGGKEEVEATSMESRRCFQAVAFCDPISPNLSADTRKKPNKLSPCTQHHEEEVQEWMKSKTTGNTLCSNNDEMSNNIKNLFPGQGNKWCCWGLVLWHQTLYIIYCMSSSAWSNYPTQTLASVAEAQGNDNVWNLYPATSWLRIIKPFPLRVDFLLVMPPCICMWEISVCVSVHVRYMCESVVLRQVHLYVRLVLCESYCSCREAVSVSVWSVHVHLQYNIYTRVYK